MKYFHTVYHIMLSVFVSEFQVGNEHNSCSSSGRDKQVELLAKYFKAQYKCGAPSLLRVMLLRSVRLRECIVLIAPSTSGFTKDKTVCVRQGLVRAHLR